MAIQAELTGAGLHPSGSTGDLNYANGGLFGSTPDMNYNPTSGLMKFNTLMQVRGCRYVSTQAQFLAALADTSVYAIELEAGTYTLAADVDVTQQNVQFIWSWGGATITGAATAFALQIAKSHIHLYGITIAHTAGSDNGLEIAGNDLVDITVERCWFTLNNTGLSIKGAAGHVITGVRIIDCIFSQSVLGLDLDYVEKSSFSGCRWLGSNSSDTGVVFNHTQFLDFDKPAFHTIDVYALSFVSTNVDITISDPQFYDCDQAWNISNDGGATPTNRRVRILEASGDLLTRMSLLDDYGLESTITYTDRYGRRFEKSMGRYRYFEPGVNVNTDFATAALPSATYIPTENGVFEAYTSGANNQGYTGGWNYNPGTAYVCPPSAVNAWGVINYGLNGWNQYDIASTTMMIQLGCVINPPALADVKVRFGLGAQGAALPTNGIFLEYDSALSANWRLHIRSGSASAWTDTGVAASLATNTRIELAIYNQSHVDVWINGVWVLREVTGLPVTSRQYCAFQIWNTAGAANLYTYLHAAQLHAYDGFTDGTTA